MELVFSANSAHETKKNHSLYHQALILPSLFFYLLTLGQTTFHILEECRTSESIFYHIINSLYLSSRALERVKRRSLIRILAMESEVFLCTLFEQNTLVVFCTSSPDYLVSMLLHVTTNYGYRCRCCYHEHYRNNHRNKQLCYIQKSQVFRAI